jgi:glycosyltransferase involved in cell wall biosynthesis
VSAGDCTDVQPGISAVLAVDPYQVVGLETVLLDLAAVLDGLVADNFEIIVVNVGSSEQRTELAADLAVRRPALPLRVLGEEFANPPTALAAGFEATTYDLILVVAPDGQFDVLELNHLLDAIEYGADLALGFRTPRTDRIWNTLVNLAFGPTARDVDCAFKLFRRRVWERVKPRSRAATFNVALVVGARRLGFSIAEVGVSQRRPAAETRGEFWSALRELIELRLGREPDAAQRPTDAAVGAPVGAGRRAA